MPATDTATDTATEASPADTADRTRRHLTHVARGGALGLFGAAVSAGAGFILTLIVTNRYPTDSAGLFFTVTSAFLLMSAVATLGTESGLGRFLLRYEAHDRRGDIPPTIRAAFRTTIAYSILLALLIIVLAGPLARLIGLGGEPHGALILKLLACALPFATWNALTLAGTRAFGRMRATVIVEKIMRPVAQPVLVVVVSYTTAGLVGLTLAWAVPYIVAAVASWWLFRALLARRGTMQHTEPTKPYRELRREFWKFTWPRSITSISQMAIQRMDIILIAALRTPREAAIYTAATRFVALGQFGTQAIQQVIQPRFTVLLARNESESLRDVYRISAAWSMAVTWPMFVGVAAAPTVYLSLFGSEYRDAGVAVVLLMAISMLFAVASGAADTLLLMSGRSTLSLSNNLAALALDIGLCLVLIPVMGITGAALAWAVAITARCLLSLLQIRATLSITSFGRAAAIIAVANIVSFGAPLALAGTLFDPNLIEVALIVVLCLPIYVLCLWIGRRELMLDVLRGLVRRPTLEKTTQVDE